MEPAETQGVVEVVPYKGKKRGRKPGFGTPAAVRAKKSEKRRKDIVELTCAGVEVKDIATIVDCSEAYVVKVRKEFKPIFKSLDKVKDFRAIKTEVLDAAQFEMLKSAVSPEKLKKAPLGQVAYAFRQFYDAGRLESGKSTQNTAVSFTNKSS